MTARHKSRKWGKNAEENPAKMRQKQELCIHRIRNPFVKAFQKYIRGQACSLMDSTGKQRPNPFQSHSTPVWTCFNTQRAHWRKTRLWQEREREKVGVTHNEPDFPAVY